MPSGPTTAGKSQRNGKLKGSEHAEYGTDVRPHVQRCDGSEMRPI